MRKHSIWNAPRLCEGLALALVGTAHAAYDPIAITQASYNQDVVVEKSAPAANKPAVTATMDGSIYGTGSTWYEMGYNGDSPDSGLPASGSTFTSETDPAHSFTLQSYTAANAVMITSTLTNATLQVTTPAKYSGLSFLASSGNGANTIKWTTHYQDGTTETGTFSAPDWFGNTNIAYTAKGRVDMESITYSAVDTDNPRLYQVDVALAKSASALASIDLAWVTGTANSAILAVSGLNNGNYQPIAATGFTYDIVVEKTASQPVALTSGFSATVYASSDSTVTTTFYEQGYNPTFPTAGLPAAGTTVTDLANTNRTFTLAASYTANNAILIDANNPTATASLKTPASYSALAFLGCAGNSASKVLYTIHYSSGATQTGSFTLPLWTDKNATAACLPDGYINTATSGFGYSGTKSVKLFAAEVGVDNASANISSVDLTFDTDNNDSSSTACVLAMSGTSGSVKPGIATEPANVRCYAGTGATLTVNAWGTAPLAYQWYKVSGSNYTALAASATYSGVTTSNLTVNGASYADDASFAVVVTNAVGVVTSAVAQASFLVNATSIALVGDPIEGFGGNTPDAETVDHAIDGDTQKYLNFGNDGDTSSPFVGPVGFIVTPSGGAGKTVTALRFYTANDAEERDPADYILEGSNDGGTTYTKIASGNLSLPGTRNNPGQTIDPLTQACQEAHFANNKTYTTYKVTFTNVKNNSTAVAMQIGEVELLPGTPTVAQPTLTYTRGTGTITITSSAAGTLQSTTELKGTSTVWTNEGAIATSQTITIGTGNKFFRVLAQ